MKKTGIFFGSTSGTTENIARQIAVKLGISFDDVHNIASTPVEKAEEYDILLLGTSTWGVGDLQDDWLDFLPKLASLDLAGKSVGLFGCGDSSSFSDTFCDGMGTIYCDLQSSGCRFIGSMDQSGYMFSNSLACIDGKFIGLAIDENNEGNLTGSRIDEWIVSLRADGME